MVGGGVGVVAQSAHQGLVGFPGLALQEIPLMGHVAHDLIAVVVGGGREGGLLAGQSL